MKILIVENEPDIAEMERMALSASGYDCVVVASGREAIDKYTDEFCLILLDIGMPELTGLDVAEAIRAKDKDVPILAVTGYDSVLMKSQARRAGINQVLAKPVDVQQLRKWVERLINVKCRDKWVKSGEMKL